MALRRCKTTIVVGAKTGSTCFAPLFFLLLKLPFPLCFPLPFPLAIPLSSRLSMPLSFPFFLTSSYSFCPHYPYLLVALNML